MRIFFAPFSARQAHPVLLLQTWFLGHLDHTAAYQGRLTDALHKVPSVASLIPSDTAGAAFSASDTVRIKREAVVAGTPSSSVRRCGASSQCKPCFRCYVVS